LHSKDYREGGVCRKKKILNLNFNKNFKNIFPFDMK
jgi:hypothetical protein